MVLIVGQNSVWQYTYNLTSLRPGTVNRVASVFASAAGKGSNVARALGFLGRQSFLLAYIGGPNGEKFRAACEADGIRSDFTTIEGETRICTTLIEASGVITEVVEPAPAVSLSERTAFRESFERRLPEAHLLAISGTAMTGEDDDCYLEFVRSAHRNDVPVVLDSYRDHGRAALMAAPEVLKINADELHELSGMDCGSAAGRRHASEHMMERYGVRWIIITRGKAGAEAFDGKHAYTAAAPKVELKNAIGSGDAFTAGIIARLLHEVPAKIDGGPLSEGFPWRADLADALQTGTAMGTANCMNLKPGLIKSDDYEETLRKVSMSQMPD